MKQVEEMFHRRFLLSGLIPSLVYGARSGTGGGRAVGKGEVLQSAPRTHQAKPFLFFPRMMYEYATYNIQCTLSPLDSMRQASPAAPSTAAASLRLLIPALLVFTLE